MSTLEQAIAGRPGWEMLANGTARYNATAAGNTNSALLGWAEKHQDWAWEVHADRGQGRMLADDCSKHLISAIEMAEQYADRRVAS